ncbi:unnamed protein product, partial [Rotaria magnacalcarata]
MSNISSDNDVIVLPNRTNNRQSSTNLPSHIEGKVDNQSGDMSSERNGIITALSTADDKVDENKQEDN